MKLKIEQVPSVENLGKQGYHYDTKELFEPITKSDEIKNQLDSETPKLKLQRMKKMLKMLLDLVTVMPLLTYEKHLV